MIEYKTGDIFKEEAQAIVNTVNCVGVMGRGIALQFKKRFPENFKKYEVACKHKEVMPGKMFVFKTGEFIGPKYIINFPTKRHWRGKSRMEDIDSGLIDLVQVIKDNNIQSIALPPLGCGLGGLEWSEVRSRIELLLAELTDVQTIVFEPKGAPVAEKMAKSREVPKMTPGRASLIELVQRYLNGLLYPFVTLLEIHKLMYFMQEAGENLRLKYSKAPYGPYAENLSHVLNAIEGHFVSGYADGGDKPDKQLKLVAGAYEEATAFLAGYENTQKHFKRVADLVEGFESPFGLELLATVHWVVKNNSVSSKQEIVSEVYKWNERKKQFSRRQIEIAVDVLANKNWIDI
jgi:O-acetyl-ADP-ribose deacetylase (regulator of RNase III)